MADQQSAPAPPPYTPANSINTAAPTPQAMATSAVKPPKKIPSIEQFWYKKGIFGLNVRAALRILQFVFAIIVAGLYAVDLAHATKTNSRGPTEWIYANMVVCFSVITCAVHALVTVKRVAWSAWDGVLFVLWLAQVGVFGTIYYSSDIKPEYKSATKSVSRMKAAVWIDVINMMLWFLTFVLGVAWCIRARRLTRRTDKLGASQDPDVERMGEQENGIESFKQKCFERSGYEAGYENIDEKMDDKWTRRPMTREGDVDQKIKS